MILTRPVKNILSGITSAAFLLASAAQAFAVNVELCPTGSSQFGPLCVLGNDPGQAFANFVALIIQLAFVLATIVAVIFLIWGGIRWIISGGDKAAVESARNTIIAAIIGLVIVFLSFVIIAVVGRIFKIDLFRLELPTI